LCALVALLAFAGNAGAVTRTGGTGTDPWIASEMPDYAPGSAVNLMGGSWQPGESVHINVNDNDGQTWVRNADVTADANGDITKLVQSAELVRRDVRGNRDGRKRCCCDYKLHGRKREPTQPSASARPVALAAAAPFRRRSPRGTLRVRVRRSLA